MRPESDGIEGGRIGNENVGKSGLFRGLMQACRFWFILRGNQRLKRRRMIRKN
jgi:hypothetical protein